MVTRKLLVIPAVDVLGLEAVRLEQGDFERISLHAGGPLELVARFAAAGPPLIHLVDLDGARSGLVRPELVAAAVAAAGGGAGCRAPAGSPAPAGCRPG